MNNVNKELIIDIILQDMKYHEHMFAIYRNSEVPKIYNIDLLKIVASLFSIKKDEILDEFIDRYMETIHIGKDTLIEKRYQIADGCYDNLFSILNQK